VVPKAKSHCATGNYEHEQGKHGRAFGDLAADSQPQPPHAVRSCSPCSDASMHVFLMLENLCDCCRPDDLRKEFEKFGEVRDVYIPKDFYTRCVSSAVFALY
jgi:hypothetical protein